MENRGAVPQKANIELPFDMTVPPLGIYPKEIKSLCQKGICTTMFIAAPITVAKK
jgi:hypothetical protein